jgi:hypothetical protein
MISSQLSLTGTDLRTPRAAAFAGIIFSVLLFIVFGLMRLSVPADPLEQGAWLAEDTTYVVLAMNLVPFAGVAFLWLVGVLRTFHFGRGLAYGMINIYLVKTAAVFMITTSTIAVYTSLTPRWLAIGGYAVAVILLIGSSYFSWGLLVFPLWVLLVSLSILRDKDAVPVSTDGPPT